MFSAFGFLFPFASTIFKDDHPASIKPETENIFIDTVSSENIFKGNFSETKKETVEPVESRISGVNSDTGIQDQYSDPLAFLHEEDSEIEIPEEKIIDPHEVIRKRLNEILGKPETIDSEFSGINSVEKVSQEDSLKKEVADGKEIQPEIKQRPLSETTEQQETKPVRSVFNIADEEQIISTEAKNVKDVIDKIGLEHAMEESIIHSIVQFEDFLLFIKKIKRLRERNRM